MTSTTATVPGLDPLLASGVIAVIRVRETAALGAAARALAAGGVGGVEITLTTPGAIEAIGDLASDSGLAGCLLGAGTVLDEAAARDVIAAGARFVVSPVLDPAVIRVCRDRHIPCIPGAFTPMILPRRSASDRMCEPGITYRPWALGSITEPSAKMSRLAATMASSAEEDRWPSS